MKYDKVTGSDQKTMYFFLAANALGFVNDRQT